MQLKLRSITMVLVVFVVASMMLRVQPAFVNAQGPGAENMSNEEVIQAMAEAINAGDVERALSYYAENAYFIGYWMGELEAQVGHDQIRALFENLIAGDFHIECDVISTYGDGSVLLTDTHTSGAGMPPTVQPLHLYDLYVIKDGKIVVYTYYLSEESLAAMMEVMAAMVPAPITAEEIVGTWRWYETRSFRFQFRSDGTFRASDLLADLNSDTPQDIGTYRVEDGVLYVTSGDDSRYCHDNALGVYALSWSLDGDLVLTLQDDACYTRRAPSSNPQPFTWESEAP
jgi:predicted SnoaL-like aldol condensation-catalyzing enzyme